MCVRASQTFTPGVTPGTIPLTSALCLTPDLSEWYSVIVLNMSRPLTDRWGQKKRANPRTSLTLIYKWKRRHWKDFLDIGWRDSWRSCCCTSGKDYPEDMSLCPCVNNITNLQKSQFYYIIKSLIQSQKTLNEAVLISLEPNQFSSI